MGSKTEIRVPVDWESFSFLGIDEFGWVLAALPKDAESSIIILYQLLGGGALKRLPDIPIIGFRRTHGFSIPKTTIILHHYTPNDMLVYRNYEGSQIWSVRHVFSPIPPSPFGRIVVQDMYFWLDVVLESVLVLDNFHQPDSQVTCIDYWLPPNLLAGLTFLSMARIDDVAVLVVARDDLRVVLYDLMMERRYDRGADYDRFYHTKVKEVKEWEEEKRERINNQLRALERFDDFDDKSLFIACDLGGFDVRTESCKANHIYFSGFEADIEEAEFIRGGVVSVSTMRPCPYYHVSDRCQCSSSWWFRVQ